MFLLHEADLVCREAGSMSSCAMLPPYQQLLQENLLSISMPQSGWIPVALDFPVVFRKNQDDPHEGTCTAGAGRAADNQSMSLLNYSSTRKMQAWKMQDQMYSFVYRDTGDFLPPFLATPSWAKKQK